MKKSNKKLIMDHVILVVVISFTFGCIATTHRTANTLEKKQLSTSAHYLRAENLEESDARPIHLTGIDFRYGIFNRLDIGAVHTWDATKDNEGGFSSIWGDVKIQLTNNDRGDNKPVLSTGLLKGYIYDPDIKLHVTSLPLYFSYDHNRSITSTLFFRYELIREGFIPSDIFRNPRLHVGSSIQFKLAEDSSERWQPKFSLGLGYFNSLSGDPGDASGLTFNVGISIDSPF